MLDLVGEPDAAILHVRFDERGVETVHGRILRHWQPKGPAPATADLPTALLLDSTGASAVRRVKVVLILWVRDPSWRAVGHQEAVEVDREVTNGREPLMSTGGESRSASVRAVT